jgi:hypothetical protein
MQRAINNTKEFMANLRLWISHWKTNTDEWDRYYLCAASPLSAEFVRDYEEAERHHPQW